MRPPNSNARFTTGTAAPLAGGQDNSAIPAKIRETTAQTLTNRRPRFVRRYVWLFLLVLLFWAGARWLALRGKPERLGDIEESQNRSASFIYDGKRYSYKGNGGSNNPGNGNIVSRGVLQVSSLLGKAPRALTTVQDFVGFRDPHDDRTGVVQDGFLYYLTGKHAGRTPLPQPEGQISKQSTGRTLIKPDWETLTLWRLPLQGGQPQPVLKGLQSAAFAFLKSNVYWMQARPDATITIKDKKGVRTSVENRSSLMETSLLTGATRRVATGLSWRTPLVAGKACVYWPVGHYPPQEKLHTELMRYCPGDPAPRQLLFDHNYEPMEADGRLYSIVSTFTEWNRKTGITSLQSDLVSWNLDGTDGRVILNLVAHKKALMKLNRLFVHHNHLYGFLTSWPSGQTEEGTAPEKQETSLVRIQPGATPVLQKICKLPPLPESTDYDEHYCYFQTHEVRERWFSSDLSLQSASVLYRFPLPD